ncbi:hypothetical protein [Pseudocnuella soli]|uniref:hypothetical protein n=1 Tax=Pseudocnuella soli TaxID=2502779 RepID=UPI0010454F44|nr:hypothetical protein [Pseudocnuella soli]
MAANFMAGRQTLYFWSTVHLHAKQNSAGCTKLSALIELIVIGNDFLLQLPTAPFTLCPCSGTKYARARMCPCIGHEVHYEEV